MKNLSKLILLVVGLGVASCNPKFYSPNTQNVPLISEKEKQTSQFPEMAIKLSFKGYGITENIAIKANGVVFIPSNLDNGNGGSGKFIEIGGGYFKPIKENWVFESYGIIGFGNFENHLPSTKNDYPLTNGNISANILRVGIQPNFGYKSKYFSVAISSRIVHLSYSKIKGDLIFEDKKQIDYLENNSSNYLIEPALTVRGGLEKIKLQVQYGYSLNLSNIDFKQDKTFLTVGLNFNFN